jgi:hypothetical protein
MNEEDTDEPEVVGIPGYYNKLEPVAATPDTLQSVPTCTCSKHPLWDGYDGDCPIHGWFEPVAPDTPQSVPATEKRDTENGENARRLSSDFTIPGITHA